MSFSDVFRTAAIILIALPLLLALIALAVFGFILLIRWLEWKAVVLAARRGYLKEHFKSDGTPFPPFGRGMCDCCGMVFDKVYYTPGRRLCQVCYDTESPPQAGAGQSAQQAAPTKME
jgi:hypothetical protein